MTQRPRVPRESSRLSGLARSMTEVEWLMLALVVLYAFVTDAEAARSPGVVAALLGFAAFVLVFRFVRPLARHARLELVAEIAAMLVFLTVLLAQLGGLTSPLTSLYLLPVVAAALTLGRRAAAVVVTAVALAYAVLATLAGGSAALTPAFATAAVGTLAPFALVAFSTALLAESIDTARQRIRALSERDDATGLYNLRAFKLLAASEHDGAERVGLSYALLMVDIEKLKTVNETHGHDAGNRAIELVAAALTRLTRATDVVARYSGDEFIVLVANADEAAACEIAQRVRNVVFATTLDVGGRIVRLKVNIGVAVYPDDGGTLQAVMTAADRMMYKDKELREPPRGKVIAKKP
jgi:diguanylate cyclase (GGDEF)-like protein